MEPALSQQNPKLDPLFTWQEWVFYPHGRLVDLHQRGYSHAWSVRDGLVVTVVLNSQTPWVVANTRIQAAYYSYVASLILGEDP